MDKTKILILKNLMTSFSEEIKRIFNIPLDDAFIASTYFLLNKDIPYLKNISDDDNKIVKKFVNDFSLMEYSKSEIRRSYMEAYFYSLKDKESYTVNVSLELPLMYIKLIVDIILPNIPYKDINVLNALGNNGNLASSLSNSEWVSDNNLYVTVLNDKERILASNLRDLLNYHYEITESLPSLSYRCDLIVSDPLLRKSEDILVFFEDYLEYLNQDGFMVVVLPTQFVRSRIFSDLLEDHQLILLGLIEYPVDIVEGIMKSSIVVLEKKFIKNNEFFHAEMSSIKDVNGNIEVMKNVKEYLIEYFKGETKNENNVN